MRRNLWGLVKPLGENETITTRISTPTLEAKDEQALGVIITSLEDNFVHFVGE